MADDSGGEGTGSTDFPAALDAVLGTFEDALVDRWQQTIYDVVWAMDAMPPSLVRSVDGTEVAWDHRTPEIRAHINTEGTHGCAYLTWFEDGHNGKVQSVTCDGKIWAPGDGNPTTTEWNGTTVELPQSTHCGIGELFAAAEDWAWDDRKFIFDYVPPFANQKLSVLEEARNTLVELAAEFGAELSGDGAAGYTADALQAEVSLKDEVGSLFVKEGEQKGWRVQWTGTAADALADGIFASTNPTLVNHAVIAYNLSALINLRATIIHTYRENSLNLIRFATEALGAQTVVTTDLTNVWKVVQGVGMAAALVPAPPAAAASAVIGMVGWLGAEFLEESKEVSFRAGPGEVAIDLYESFQSMESDLNSISEADYEHDVAEFRKALNDVPATFLELYDITENSPTGTH